MTGKIRWDGKLLETINALRGCDVIGRGGLVDAGHEFLRVAIDDRKPRGLNLHHDAMSFQEDMVVIAQRDVPFVGLSGISGCGVS